MAGLRPVKFLDLDPTAQTLLALPGLDATDLLALPWERAFALAGVAAVLSVATSLVTVGTGSDGPGVTETPYDTRPTTATGGNP
ncbi:holin [Streptomyces sp. NPDC059866]|uniref:holin n=1 Tax=Streptomyces sp. NPDC059866 TaxID=3346978 RepID=UPI00364BD46E